MSNLKMYILVKRSVPIGLGVNSVGHTSLATYLKFKDDPVMQAWLASKHFRKVTCVVSDKEFEKAKKYTDYVVMTENALSETDNAEIAIGFKPREEWPDFFRSLKLFGSHLQEKEIVRNECKVQHVPDGTAHTILGCPCPTCQGLTHHKFEAGKANCVKCGTTHNYFRCIPDKET